MEIVYGYLLVQAVCRWISSSRVAVFGIIKGRTRPPDAHPRRRATPAAAVSAPPPASGATGPTYGG